MPHTLASTADLLRVLAEATRLRLVLVLSEYSLTVAELTELTGLAQSRVSTHLARLRRHKILVETRQGSISLQALNPQPPETVTQVLTLLRTQTDADELQRDRETAQALLARRLQKPGWAARVAGEMEKHYSPGRGWEVTARAFVPLLQLGDVLDIAAGDGVMAELIAPHARHVTCVEWDTTVLAAGRTRLQRGQVRNAHYVRADMHALPYAEPQFDCVLLLNALTYSADPQRAIAEAAKVLRPGGVLCLSTLDQHTHAASVAAYDHCNNGFTRTALISMLEAAGLSLLAAPALPIQETRPPFHHVHVLHAQRRPHAAEATLRG